MRNFDNINNDNDNNIYLIIVIVIQLHHQQLQMKKFSSVLFYFATIFSPNSIEPFFFYTKTNNLFYNRTIRN